MSPPSTRDIFNCVILMMAQASGDAPGPPAAGLKRAARLGPGIPRAECRSRLQHRAGIPVLQPASALWLLASVAAGGSSAILAKGLRIVGCAIASAANVVKAVCHLLGDPSPRIYPEQLPPLLVVFATVPHCATALPSVRGWTGRSTSPPQAAS